MELYLPVLAVPRQQRRDRSPRVLPGLTGGAPRPSASPATVQELLLLQLFGSSGRVSSPACHGPESCPTQTSLSCPTLMARAFDPSAQVLEGDDMQRYPALLRHDSFINQLAATAADVAAGHSCQPHQLFFSARAQAPLEGFLHNSPLLLLLNPFVHRRAAPAVLRFLPTCSPGSNGRIVRSRSASPRRMAAVCRRRGLCVSLSETRRSQGKQERRGKKKKKKRQQALFRSLLYQCLHKSVCGLLISLLTNICYLLSRFPLAPAARPRGADALAAPRGRVFGRAEVVRRLGKPGTRLALLLGSAPSRPPALLGAVRWTRPE
ncbi:uncharacterized protein VSU04_013330 isoform 1-T1 [Chlamydotis macqueenii]